METLETRNKRLEAVINVREPDRIPVMPKISWFAGRYAGITAEEFLFDRGKNGQAIEKTWRDFGGWDIIFENMTEDPARRRYNSGMKCLFPGKELPRDSTFQFVETEVMTEDDYDVAAAKGWQYFNRNVLLPRLYPGVDLDMVDAEIQAAKGRSRDAQTRWLERGLPPLTGARINGFEVASFARSLVGFIKDIYRCPDSVMRFAEAHTESAIAEARRQAKESGIPRARGGGRIPCSVLSPQKWERLIWPYLRKTIVDLYADGIVTYLHWDGDWLTTLPYLKELPKGSCFVDLDGYTDIFKAKEILKGQVCIAGDVPNSLLVFGSPEDVTEYCKRLINVVGDGGGFLLSSGCAVPIDARPENVRAMIETAMTYGVY